MTKTDLSEIEKQLTSLEKQLDEKLDRAGLKFGEAWAQSRIAASQSSK